MISIIIIIIIINTIISIIIVIIIVVIIIPCVHQARSAVEGPRPWPPWSKRREYAQSPC